MAQRHVGVPGTSAEVEVTPHGLLEEAVYGPLQLDNPWPTDLSLRLLDTPRKPTAAPCWLQGALAAPGLNLRPYTRSTYPPFRLTHPQEPGPAPSAGPVQPAARGPGSCRGRALLSRSGPGLGPPRHSLWSQRKGTRRARDFSAPAEPAERPAPAGARTPWPRPSVTASDAGLGRGSRRRIPKPGPT